MGWHVQLSVQWHAFTLVDCISYGLVELCEPGRFHDHVLSACHDCVSRGGSRARPLTNTCMHSSSLLNCLRMTGCPLERPWTLPARDDGTTSIDVSSFSIMFRLLLLRTFQPHRHQSSTSIGTRNVKAKLSTGSNPSSPVSHWFSLIQKIEMHARPVQT